MTPTEDPTEEILALERDALVRWCSGDPDGYLEISAPDVVYFDPFLERRIDGLEALTRYYDGIRGKVRAERFEILHPVVIAAGDMAVLSFHFVSWGGNENAFRWNATEVYRRRDGVWRIVSTHWSFTNAGLPPAQRS